MCAHALPRSVSTVVSLRRPLPLLAASVLGIGLLGLAPVAQAGESASAAVSSHAAQHTDTDHAAHAAHGMHEGHQAQQGHAGHGGHAAQGTSDASAQHGLIVEGAYTVAPRPGVPNIAIYISRVENGSDKADELLSARADIARRTELHEMKMEGEVMRMRQLGTIGIPAGGSVDFNKGASYHLMVLGVTQPLKEGDHFPLFLNFRNAGERVIQVRVQKAPSPSMGTDHGAHAHGHAHSH